KPIEPLGKISIENARNAFIEQAEALLEGGVDLFIIETISHIEEMALAAEALKTVTDIPIIAQLTFTAEGTTYFGSTPAEMAARLLPMNVDVIGTNCSVGPQKALEVVEQLSEMGVPRISAQPNAGLPRYYGGRFVYLSSPDYFAEYAGLFVKSGARIVGGCCGTTPEHIAAVARALKDSTVKKPPKKIKRMPAGKSESIIPAGGVSTPFSEKLKKSFVVSVEIDPPKGTNPAKLIDAAARLKEAGADAVNIADSPMARVRMSCLALAYLIKSSVDLGMILHFTTRDRNLMGLQSDLIGAHAIGIRNILALTGDPPSIGDYPQATAVYDVDSIGLIKIISKLNSGYDFAGNSIGKPTTLSIGVAANPTNPEFETEIARLREKLDAGGQYIMTQPLYELDPLERFLDTLNRPDIPVMLGVLPLVSYKHAQFMHNEVPGIEVPDNIRLTMEKAGENSAAVGGEIAWEFIEKAKSMVSGIYLMPSFGRFETSIDIVENLKKTTKD
ncbi:MAG: bifunctional homocysteine S-methyltransferase/methylenetetrahydrofolate reductase, partial [candidate division Zixibacteria bacterium]